MKNSTSNIHYRPAGQPQISTKAALLVFAGAIGLAVAVFSIIH
ncbi:MAG: hypothetical protein ABSH26_10465 [Opitutaceae bacterium]